MVPFGTMVLEYVYHGTRVHMYLYFKSFLRYGHTGVPMVSILVFQVVFEIMFYLYTCTYTYHGTKVLEYHLVMCTSKVKNDLKYKLPWYHAR